MKHIAFVPIVVLLFWAAACTESDGKEDPAAASAQPGPAPVTPPPTAGDRGGLANVQSSLLYDFEGNTVGMLPRGFYAAHTGRGTQGRWEVIEVGIAPSGRLAVAQLDADRTNYRFPLLVLDAPTARDVKLSVMGHPVSGTKDQAIGLIWRYQDADNYYVVRANALEDNVVLYKMENGRRTDLPLVGKGRTYGVDVPVPAEAWSRLGVRVEGELFTVFLDGHELFQVTDETFQSAGRVGLWTKADSVTWFDDLRLTVLDDGQSGEAAKPTEGGG